ncbi:putative methyltransferase NSUN6 isoform X2 [Olea europaea var. sylvestris]|uniref:putative methyltransferase NSUN6 isoform X2 n=1 Tax=Olea europaea var. sylvestris TaxID=158386 RepID=UPI000C1D3DF1|nr:putative methyltransferase NSUN6 isoform X2 [Olea europaea var. sylvestris]
MKEGVFLKTLCRTLLTRHPRKPNSPLHLQMDRLERYCYNPTLRWNPQVEEYFIKAYGADYFHRISTALTRPSCYSCIRVNTLQSTTGDVIEKLLAILQERRQQNGSSDGTNVCHISDDLAKATLGSSETILPNKSVQDCFIEKCQIPSLDYVVFVKGSGPHTIDYGHIANKPPKEVVVSRKCAEAVLRGAQVYVPGVLACSAHVEKGEVVAVSVAVEQPSSTGGWGVGFTRGTILQGSQTDPYYFERKGLYIGQGTTVMSRAGIFRASEGVAVDMVHRIYKLPSFRDILEGEIFLQNLPSIITAHALDPQEGERILDMCAAPGGKTTAIAILMKDKGEVIAVDRSHNKVFEIQKLAAELGLKCITTYKLDALKSVQQMSESDRKDTLQCGEKIESIGISDSLTAGIEKITCTAICGTQGGLEQMGNESHISKAELRKNNRKLRNGPGRNNCLGGRVEKSKGFPPNSFDRVLLDAPCSALGLRPRLFAGEETMESLRTHAKYQRRMFDQAVQLVRPGGVIVYSTCTINPGENEALVRYALDTYKFLSLASQGMVKTW